jgi:hypothetical protein
MEAAILKGLELGGCRGWRREVKKLVNRWLVDKKGVYRDLFAVSWGGPWGVMTDLEQTVLHC